jgi:hypothetical protein
MLNGISPRRLIVITPRYLIGRDHQSILRDRAVFFRVRLFDIIRVICRAITNDHPRSWENSLRQNSRYRVTDELAPIVRRRRELHSVPYVL